MRTIKTVFLTLLVMAVLITAVFLAGRYGWKLLGFRLCEGAGIEEVQVSEQTVRIRGFYPGAFPAGFCGCYSREEKGTLYVGFRFSGLFGILETGDFDISIPVSGEIQKVVVKAEDTQTVIWQRPEPAEDAPAVTDAYASVIGQYYDALAAGWDPGEMMEAGLNYMTAEAAIACPLEEVGYAVADLDGDGKEELAIGSLKEDAFYGKLIFSLYVLDEQGTPSLLFDSTERNRYYYAGGIRFANLGSCDWNESFVTTLKLQDNEMVDMTYTTDPADYVRMELTPLARWGETE